MKTNELIKALSRDATVAPPPQRTLGLNLACGAVLALAAFFLVLGLRPDILQALQTPRFVLKLLLTLSLLVGSLGVLLRLARPGARIGVWARVLLVAPLALAAAIVVELCVLPGSLWSVRAVGHNALWCVTMIPLLALAPLACCLLALREAAPTRPALTGAVAGLVAGAVAASFYALHCPDDSPLFVGLWYVLALAIVSSLGAVGGSRLLRW